MKPSKHPPCIDAWPLNEHFSLETAGLGESSASLAVANLTPERTEDSSSVPAAYVTKNPEFQGVSSKAKSLLALPLVISTGPSGQLTPISLHWNGNKLS
jgi:hypothetical protein